MLIALPNPDGSFHAVLFAQGDPGFEALATPQAARAFFASFRRAGVAGGFRDAGRQLQGQLGTIHRPWQAGRVLLTGMRPTRSCPSMARD